MKKPIVFGKYQLFERINVGGMAEVFVAKAFGVEGFERILAIKKILPTMAEDEEFISMFVDEARISAQLNHANIVQIHDFGKADGSYYLAMEYVSSRDLRAVLERFRRRKEPMPVGQAVFIASKLCEALDYAHRKRDPRGKDLGIIHRDVSPQNVLLSYEGEIKLIDFGIAKAANRPQRTQAGVLKGKFGYMSPEQVRGMPMDRRSDIFSLGVVFYEMIIGEKLFTGESDFSTLEKVRNAEIPLPTSINPNLPAGLEKVMLKALAREPEDRYQWASDLQEDLMRFLVNGDAIYSSKHLAAFLRETFPEDLTKEAERMERFAQLLPEPRREIKDVPEPRTPAARLLGPRVVSRHSIEERTQLVDPNANSLSNASWARPASAELANDPVRPTRPRPALSEDAEQVPSTALLPATGGTVSPKVKSPSVPWDKSGEHSPVVPGRSRLGNRWPLALAVGIAISAVAGAAAFVRIRPVHAELMVAVEPATATILLNGQPLRNRAVNEVIPGDHPLEITAEGFQPDRRTVTLRKGESQSLALALQPILPPDSPGSGEEHPNQEPPKAVSAEKPPVTVEHPAAAVAPSSKETPAKETPKYAPAKEGSAPATYSVHFSGDEDVEVWLAGKFVGRTPKASVADLKVGQRYAYMAKRVGFRSKSGTVVFNGLGKPQMEVALRMERLEKKEKPLPKASLPLSAAVVPAAAGEGVGKLACSSNPQGAQVWVDGQYSGRTTPIGQGSPLVLPVGVRSIVFKTVDGKLRSAPLKVTISKDSIEKLTNVALQ